LGESGCLQSISSVWNFEHVGQVVVKGAARSLIRYVGGVHKVAGLPVISVVADRRVKEPRFRPCRVGEPFITNPKIVVPHYGEEIQGPRVLASLLHETGHAIDMLAFGNREVLFASETHIAWNDWRLSVMRSAHIKDLRSKASSPPCIPGVDPCKYDIDYEASALRNLLFHEIWARSYAQYIAVKCDDQDLVDMLRSPLELTYPEHVDHWVPRQWDDEDFQPVEASIDALFEGLGWLVVE